MSDIIEYPKTHSPWKRDDKGVFTEETARPWVDMLTHAAVYATEKVDGTNTRFSFTEGILGRTSKSEWNQDVLEDLGAPYDRFVKAVERGAVRTDALLFGETVGPKIQGNPYDLGKDAYHEFILFDVWSPTLGFADRHIVAEVAEAVGVRTPNPIPRIDFASAIGLQQHIDGIINCIVQGIELSSELFPGSPAEGLIFRPLVEMLSGRGERIQLKLKFRDMKRLLEAQE